MMNGRMEFWRQTLDIFRRCREMVKNLQQSKILIHFETGGRLTENQLIEIVFFQLIKIFIISWPKFWTVFSWSKLLIMSSIKCLKFRQLIELFDQLPKSVRSFWAVDWNFKITKNDINKSFDQLSKKNWRILAVDRNFFKA